jgi:hypothetical protein
MSLLEELAKIEDQKFLDQVDNIIETGRLQALRRSFRMRGVSHELRPTVLNGDDNKPHVYSWSVTCRMRRAQEEGTVYRGLPPDSPLVRDETVTCFFCLTDNGA